MTPIAFRSLTLMLTLWLAVPLGANAASGYTIELLVAEQTSRGGQTGTLWSDGLLLPRFSRLVPLNGQLGFTPVTPTELTEASAKLRASGRYRVLAHLAWQQPAQSSNSPYAVQVMGGDRFSLYRDDSRGQRFRYAIPATQDSLSSSFATEVQSAVLNGEVAVTVGRFLHIESRLIFTDVNRGISAQVTGKRRMRSGEIHYLDNPTLAVLAIATPIE